MKSTVVAALLIVASSACSACGRKGFDVPDADVDAVPRPSNLVFATSTTHTMAEFGTNLAGADAICNARAAAAGLPGTYVAWLSTSTVAARNRLIGSRGWTLTDGRPFTDRPADLTAGVIYNPISVDESGAEVGIADYVITGTGADGGAAANCTDWTVDTDGLLSGSATATSIVWTNNSAQPCSFPGRLYCFGTGVSQPLTFTPAVGRKAFLSVQPFIPDAGGLASADALCSSEAALGNLGGTYRALLATTTASAISRFSLNGPTWVRPDGVPIADTPLAFVSGQLRSSVNVTATLGYRSGITYTGAFNIATMSLATESCADWTAPSGYNARVGFISGADDRFFGYSTNGDCIGAPIYCLEP